MSRALAVSVVGTLALVSCSSAKDQCATTQDCLSQGLQLQRCVNGKCQQTCAGDSDCKPPARVCMSGDADCERLKAEEAMKPAPSLICEERLCTLGCPDAPCGPKEKCVEGRCAHYFESFEATPP